MITIFNDLFKTDTPFFKEIDEVLELIRDNPNKEFIKRIRITEDKKEKNELKKKLKCIVFAGKFSKRSAINIVEQSGFACLDFDGYESFTKAVAAKNDLKKNEYIYSAFISPSGKGIKAIIRIPLGISDYKAYYEAICETFDSKIDEKTKDISRICYESYDPDIYINKDAKTWMLKKEFTEVTRTNSYPDYFKIDGASDKIDVIQKWFNKKFTLNVGEINSNLFKLACALNKAGMQQSECESMINNFYTNGDKKTEVKNIVASAYKNTAEFDTLTLIDNNKLEKARRILTSGDQKKAKRKLSREGLSEDQIDDILEYDFEDDLLEFWDTDKNGKIQLNDFKFKLFLENRGFFKVQLNEKEYTFVKVYNNVINEVSEIAIKDFVLNYVEQIDIKVYNFFARATAKFSEAYLNQLSTRELTMLRDTAEDSYLFFENKIAKVNKDKIEFINYIDCGGLVWKKNIIPRAITITDGVSDFKKFINNVCNKDKERILALETAMGYLLSTYKKQNEGVAIILYDETYDDNPSGRTGKTVLSKALGELRKTTTLNGKEFDNKGQFPYDTVNLDDNILCFDDLTRKFEFEALFSVITGDLTLNKKNLQPIVVPYAQSPKILFTSNYILKGEGDSHDARKVEMELYRHYNGGFQPVDDFGKLFFSIEWEDSDWNNFYSYMIRCMQTYFNTGLIRPELKSGKVRKLVAVTNDDFMFFCDNKNWDEDTVYYTKDIMRNFEFDEDTGDYPARMNTKWFGKWLSAYFEFKGWEKIDRKVQGQRGFNLKGDGVVKTQEQEILDVAI